MGVRRYSVAKMKILEILEPTVQTSSTPRQSHQTSYGVDEDNKHTIETDNGTLKAVTQGNKMRIEGILVMPVARGKGEGLSLLKRAYAEANRQGLKLASDEKVSADAVKLWQQLMQSGIKIKQSPMAKRSTNGGLFTEDRSSVFEVV
jgi:hypothetical protein